MHTKLKHSLLAAGSLTLLSLPLNLLANQSKQSTNNYINANIGFFEIYAFSDLLDKDQTSRPITYQASIGHQFNNKWAMELGYTYSRFNGNNLAYNETSVKYPTLLARYRIFTGEHANIYTKFGVGYIRLSYKNYSYDNKSDPAPFFGIGMNWHVTHHLDLNIDATGPTIGIATLASVNAGLGVKF